MCLNLLWPQKVSAEWGTRDTVMLSSGLITLGLLSCFVVQSARKKSNKKVSAHAVPFEFNEMGFHLKKPYLFHGNVQKP